MKDKSEFFIEFKFKIANLSATYVFNLYLSYLTWDFEKVSDIGR